MTTQKSYSLPSFMNSDSSLPWLLPLITMLIVFAIIPFFYNIYLSFHEFVPAKRALLFVGWDNWIRLFTDGVFCCLLYTSPSPRDTPQSRMPSSA